MARSNHPHRQERRQNRRDVRRHKGGGQLGERDHPGHGYGGRPMPQHHALVAIIRREIQEALDEVLPRIATVAGKDGGGVRVQYDEEEEPRQVGFPRARGQQYEEGRRVVVLPTAGGAPVVMGGITSGQGSDASNAVANEDLYDQAVDTRTLADNSITENKIRGNEVKGKHLDTNQIRGDHLQQDAVGRRELGPKAVGVDQIEPGSIRDSHIADNQVTRNKIPNNAINDTKIDTNAVTGDKIRNNAVTTGKIGNKQVTGDKIANSAVDKDQIANAAVDMDKLASDIKDKINAALTKADLKDIEEEITRLQRRVKRLE